MSDNIDQQQIWSKLLSDRPDLADHFKRIVDHQEQLPEMNNPWADEFLHRRCWSDEELLGIPINAINILHRRGLVEKHGSNKSKYYGVIDLVGARAALDDKAERLEFIGDDIERVEYDRPRIPEKLFSAIRGYDDIKQMFYWQIEAEDPVHIALKGPPASAKSVFLEDIHHYMPRTCWAEGYDASKSGIREQLLEERPFWLLIDEFGEMNSKNLAILRGLCSHGKVTETLHGRHREVYLPTRVDVGCNRWPPDPDGAFRSRFEILEVDRYRPGEFEDIALTTLTLREEVAEDISQYVVEKMAGLTLDVRSVVRVARLVRNAEDPLGRVDQYLEMKRRRGGGF